MPHNFSELMSVAGAHLLIGTVWNPAGLILAKSLPQRRANAFAEGGLGASSTWHGFCIDKGGIAQTDGISAVGDQRLVAGTDELRIFDSGVAWVPLEFRTQDGDPVAECARTQLRGVVDRLAAKGLNAKVGHELEFVLARPDGSALDSSAWAPYSLAGLHSYQEFVERVYALADEVGLEIDQLHAEYALNQFEFCLAPADPVTAADNLALSRYVVAQAARELDLAASFSPLPFIGSAGNGAHQHFSLDDGGTPLFSGGAGPHGITEAGGNAIAGLVGALPELQAALCGSLVSMQRMAPGMWSGAYASWGLENREASVRLIAATAANPRGANVEVKITDPSANPYIVSALTLGATLHGVENGSVLLPEAARNPAEYSPEERAALGIVELSHDLGDAIDTLLGGAVARETIGAPLVEAVAAVRRYELDTYGELSPEQLTERFRLAWSA